MRSQIAVSVLFLTLLGACGDPPPLHVLDQQLYQPLKLEFDDQIDILFVVDNSVSMESKQRLLAQGFDSFIQQFNLKKLDYQIGVISTETFLGAREKIEADPFTSEELAYFQGNTMAVAGRAEKSPYTDFNATLLPGPAALLAYKTNPKIIRANRQSSKEHLKSAAEQFKQNVKICTQTDAKGDPTCVSYNPETGARAFMAFMNPAQHLKGDAKQMEEIVKWNAGFFRPKSRKAVIIFSDEDESLPVRWKGNAQSPTLISPFMSADGKSPLETLEQRDARVKAFENLFVSEFRKLNPESPDRTYFAVVVVPDQASLDRVRATAKPGIKAGEIGHFYMQLAKRLPIADFNNILDISEKNFSAPLAALGKSIAKSFDEQVIPQPYEKDSLKVRVHIPSRKEAAWTDLKENQADGYTVRPHPNRKGAFIVKFGSEVPREEGTEGFMIDFIPFSGVQ